MDAEKDKPESLDNPKTENDDDNKNISNNECKAEKPDDEPPSEAIGETEPTEKGDDVKADGEAATEKGDDAIAVESEAKEGDEEAEINLDGGPPPSALALNLDKLSEEVDQYLCSLSAPKEDESIPLDVPNFVKQFSLMVEARVADYDSGETPVKWISLTEQDSASFLEAITRLSSLSTGLSEFSSQPNFARSINRFGAVLERAISYVEEEFKSLLEDYTFQDSDSDVGNEKQPEANDESSEENPPPPEPTSKEENHFPGYSDEILSNLVRLSKTMIAIGYETECCEAYFLARRHALEDSLHTLGFEKHSIDDVQKMQWELLEREIVAWIGIFKQCTLLFTNEQKLAKAVFPDHGSISDILLCSLAQGLTATVLNFASAVALTKSSSEKLFKFLDTYEALRDILPNMETLFPEDWMKEFKAEDSFIKSRLGEAIVSIFSELETSIKADAGRTPVPGGAIHPLTRYTMNYLKYACEYKDTLEHIFKDHQKIDSASGSELNESQGTPPLPPQPAAAAASKGSPFEAQLMKIMDLLDENLEAKSKLYKDHALSSIFLMNNGRYILQKVRGSNEVNSLMGDAWCRKKSTDLRQYHKVYQRETWGKLLSYLHPEGLTSHGKVVKPQLKERFKNFNNMFDEIHRTQSTWVVCDEQLQSELRVSISNMVVPAYRSFLGRYNQFFTPGRQTEKYVKFQGEDIENFIEELFDGKK
ncbi:hypothetical protein C2S51_018842 [Perilla frutescens var. frutescens]|nr:hypothetical protein C2S51_018842 [Perilla frutescens var. frutescens]